MRLWLLTGEYPPDYGGGIGTYAYHTAQMLCRRGHDLTVFAASENMPEGWKVEESAERLRVVRFAANQNRQSSVLGPFARWSYAAATVLSAFSRQEGGPDVLEVQEYLGMPYYTLQRGLLLEEGLRRIPVLVTAHTPLYTCGHYDQVLPHRFPGYWVGEMERFSLIAADGVISPSAYLLNELARDLPQIREYSRVVANPYQVRHQPDRETGAARRRGFLFTAKIERRKGIEPLLAAFRNLWDGGLDEPLILMGDNWYDELHQRWMGDFIRKHYGRFMDDGLLQWNGKQPPEVVQQKLKEVRAMVLPSLFENYPYAVLEAMAAGCPVVVSESGGHAEMVEDGRSGLIFSHQQEGDLEDKIQAVLHLSPEEQERMGAAAQARVKQISEYDVIGPQKEGALEWVRERNRLPRHFPFMRGAQRIYEPPDDAGEKGFLSIVIPFYNLGNYLEDTLRSLNDLQDVRHEVIVVDDGSTDPNSLETLERLQQEYRFRLIRKENQGLAAARNTGAQQARGEFLAFLDADDGMDPRFYRQALAIFQQYENISYMGCWAEYFGEAQGYWPTWNPEPPYALVHNPLNTSALVYRRADFLRFGLNDPSIKHVMEDYDSLLSMLENGCRGVSIPEPYFKYRVRGESMFHDTTDNIKIMTAHWLVQRHARLYQEYAGDVIDLVTTNGPGYLYDNPTQWYPQVGFLVDPIPASSLSLSGEMPPAPARTYLYFTIRAALLGPFEILRSKYPWMEKFRKRLKKMLLD